MQYHYTLMYDDRHKIWSVEPDPFMYYPDGNVYDRNVFPGWSVPEEGSAEEALDYNLYNTLQSIVHTFPIPQEV